MSDDLIVVADDQIDVDQIMRRIRENIARRAVAPAEAIDPVVVSREVWEATIGDPARLQPSSDRIALAPHHCDIVPHSYAINWHVPLLGRLHALARRVINAEVRRYLDASLKKQTRFNEHVLRVLSQLDQETQALRREVESLRGAGCDASR